MTNRVVSAVLFLLSLSSLAAAQEAKYVFKPGEDVLYEVTIRVEYPDRIKTNVGYLLYEPKSVDRTNGQTKLSYYWGGYRGTTQTKGRTESGSGGLPFFLRKPRTSTLGKGPDMVIDPRGTVVRTEGTGDESQLEAALGPAFQLCLQPLPPAGQKTWTTNRKIVFYHMEDSPDRSRPAGIWGQPNKQTRVESPAEESVTYTAGEIKDGFLPVQRKYDCVSMEKVGDWPATRMTGEGAYHFEIATGHLYKVEFDMAQHITAQNMTVKIPIRVEARLVPNDELAKLQEEQAASDAKAKVAAEERKTKAAEQLKNDRTGLPEGAVRTEMPCGKGGSPFTNANADKKPVVGFSLRMMRWMGKNEVINRIEPVWDPATKAIKEKDRVVVMAKPGYVVSGLIINGDDYSHCIRVVYAKLDGGKLNTKDTYTSPWIGDPYPNEKEHRIGHDGRTVIGIYGKQGMNTDGIGLVVLDPEAAAK